MKSFIIKLLFLSIVFTMLHCNEDLIEEEEKNVPNGIQIGNDSDDNNDDNGNDDAQYGSNNIQNSSDQNNIEEQIQEVEEIQKSQDQQEEENKFQNTQNNGGNNDEDIQIDIDLHQQDNQKQDIQNAEKKENQQKVDIISLEIQQIQNLIELHKTKLHLLSNLRENMLKNNITFQEFNSTLLKKKGSSSQTIKNQENEDENDNIASKINNIYSTNVKKIKLKSSKQIEFQQNTFLNRLNKKFTVESQNRIKSIKYMPTFHYKTIKEIKANQMVASLTNDQNIVIHDFSGDLAIDPYSPGHKIHLMTVSQSQEDVFIATIGEDYMIRIAKVENNKVKSQFSEDNNLKYKMKTDQSIQLDSFNKSKPINEQVRTFEYVQFKGIMRLFLIGDEQGFLHIYNKNGTFIAMEELSNQRLPILSIQKTPPNLLFYTEKEIGFFNLNTLKKSSYSCQVESSSILKVRVDTFQIGQFYALTSDQQLVAYGYSSMDEYCRVKETFDFESQLQEDEDDQFNINKQKVYYNSFVPIKNFVVLMSQQSNRMRVLNTTDIQTEGIQDGFDIVLFEKLNMSEESLQFIQQQKIYQGNHILIGHTLNQGQTTSYSLYEIIIPASKETDLFSQIRGPLVITLIIGIISWHIWKRYKGKKMYQKNPNENQGQRNNFDRFQKSSNMNNKNNVEKDLSSYKDRISQLEENTSQLLKNTQKLEKQQKPKQNRNNFDDLDDDDDNVDYRSYIGKSTSSNQRSINQNKTNKYTNFDDDDDDDDLNYRRQFDREMETND